MNKYTLTFLALTSISAAHAEEKKVQHDAHEHGVAEMNIVWDKDAVNIELESPAYNITGFEYQPSSHEQEEFIEKIEKQLNQPGELFAFNGATCKATNIKVESPFEAHDDHDDHKDDHDDHKGDHKDEHKDGHDDHKDDHKDEHKDDHDDHDDHKESVHSEYSLSYEFACSNNADEVSISAANLFKQFPQMEEVRVQWLSNTKQSSSVLTNKNSTVTLK